VGPAPVRRAIHRFERHGLRSLLNAHPGEDGYWVAECPSLPGCVSQGKT